MYKTILDSAKMLFIFTIITGVIYPLFITGIAQMFFKNKADGDLVVQNGVIIGSKKIAQNFQNQKYFWPRPSTSNFGANPSGAGNKCWTSSELKDIIETKRLILIKAHQNRDIPDEMLCASGSGLDPHISENSVLYQFERVCAARNFNESQRQKLSSTINRLKEKRDLFILGEERINVLILNIETDKIAAK